MKITNSHPTKEIQRFYYDHIICHQAKGSLWAKPDQDHILLTLNNIKSLKIIFKT